MVKVGKDVVLFMFLGVHMVYIVVLALDSFWSNYGAYLMYMIDLIKGNFLEVVCMTMAKLDFVWRVQRRLAFGWKIRIWFRFWVGGLLGVCRRLIEIGVWMRNL